MSVRVLSETVRFAVALAVGIYVFLIGVAMVNQINGRMTPTQPVVIGVLAGLTAYVIDVTWWGRQK